MSADEYLDDDEPRLASRSIFSTGWFRALLVLVVLGVVLVFAVPYALQWLEPSPPSRRQVARPEPSAPAPAPAPALSAAPEPTAAAPPSGPAPAPVAKSEPAAPPVPRPAEPLVAKTAPVTPPPARGDKLSATAKAPAARDGAGVKDAPAPDAAREARPAERLVPAPGPALGARSPEAVKPAPRRRETASRPGPARETAMARATAPRRPAGAAGAAAAGGDFWVQVGAFQDERNAERLAASLREGQLGVEVVRVIRGAAAGPDGTVSQHQVFVAGASVEAVTTALRGTGRSAQAAAGGVVVQPALPMREAVELSQKLKGAGLDASIRRVASAAAGSGGGQAFHVVRVGSYPTRAAAVAARRTVEARGIQGFVARGPAK